MDKGDWLHRAVFSLLFTSKKAGLHSAASSKSYSDLGITSLNPNLAT